MITPFYNKTKTKLFLSFSVIVLAYDMFYQFLYPCPYFSFLQVIGGDLQERLIPVPYSKSTTDQAVREIQYLLYCCSKSIYFIFIYYFYWAHQLMHSLMYIFVWMCQINLLCLFHGKFFLHFSSATRNKNHTLNFLIGCCIIRSSYMFNLYICFIYKVVIIVNIIS